MGLTKGKSGISVIPAERVSKMKKEDSMTPSDTDWEALKNMKGGDIDTSKCPRDHRLRDVCKRDRKAASKKKLITLGGDADVLDWFKAQGEEEQIRISEILRAYMDAQKNVSPFRII